MALKKAQCVILEGCWWRAHEPPLVLPYFQALASSHGDFSLSHRTFRSAEDIRFWIGKISKGRRALVYFACHGSNLSLQPVDGRSSIGRDELIDALRGAKEDAIAFLHFGSCEMVDASRRRASLRELAEASGAHWVSGYTTSIDWLQSTMLDVALLAEIYSHYANSGRRRGPKLQARANQFMADHDQMVRRLGLSALSWLHARGDYRLLPPRLR